MAPPENDKRQVQPFAAVLHEIDKGVSHAEASRALAEAIDASRDRGVKTTVVVTLTIEPLDKGSKSDMLRVSATSLAKIPPAKRKPTPLFVGANGTLTRENPMQTSLALQVVETDDAEDRVIEPGGVRVVGGEA